MELGPPNHSKDDLFEPISIRTCLLRGTLIKAPLLKGTPKATLNPKPLTLPSAMEPERGLKPFVGEVFFKKRGFFQNTRGLFLKKRGFLKHKRGFLLKTRFFLNPGAPSRG